MSIKCYISSVDGLVVVGYMIPSSVKGKGFLVQKACVSKGRKVEIANSLEMMELSHVSTKP